MTNRAWALLALTAACSGTPPASEPPPPPSTVAPPPSTPVPPTTVASPATSPCAADADCRMFAGPACACLPALTSAPVTPDPTPCFVAPCMNRAAYCDEATHACMIRSQEPSLQDIAPIS